MTFPDMAQRDRTQAEFYLHWAKDVIRYADTDRQGHVNNAVFATFLESGRVAILYGSDKPLAPKGTSFVIARLTVDFRAEIRWPGEILIGTAVLRVGGSSVTLGQGLFVNRQCMATAESVIVLVDDTVRKACPLPDYTRTELQKISHEPEKVPQ